MNKKTKNATKKHRKSVQRMKAKRRAQMNAKSKK